MKNYKLLTTLFTLASAGILNASVGLASTLGDQQTLPPCYKSENCGSTESKSDAMTQTDSIHSEKSSARAPERVRTRSIEHIGRR